MYIRTARFHMASSEKTVPQYAAPLQAAASNNGQMAAQQQAKPRTKWGAPLHVTFWNVNGLGGEWDGSHARKLATLQESGPYDAVLLVETHLRRLPVW